MLSTDINQGDIVVDLIVDEEGNPEADFLEVISVDIKSGKLIIDFDDGSTYFHDMEKDPVDFSVFRNGEWL